ncbi:cytochrome c oxidase assembly factor CtaG [Bacillaceae bacterium W0354]
MWDKIQIFGVHALWKPEIIFVTIVLALLYYLFTGPLKHVTGLEEEPPRKQKFIFYLALLLFYGIKGSPMYLLSHIVLMAHMVQMAVFYFIIPILVIKGIPELWWRKIFNLKIVGSILRLLTKPLIAILFFNLCFSLYHIPAVLDYSKTGLFVHWFIALFIFFAAMCMWWPLMTPIKEQDTIKPLYKIFYVFANGLLITPACALIIFSGEPLYATYSEPDAFMTAMQLCVPLEVLQGMNLGGPQIFLKMPLLYDQQAAGILMKVLQEIIFISVLTTIFYKWFKSENTGIDPIPTQDTNVPQYE